MWLDFSLTPSPLSGFILHPFSLRVAWEQGQLDVCMLLLITNSMASSIIGTGHWLISWLVTVDQMTER